MTLHPLQNYILCTVHEGRDMKGLHLPDSVNVQPYAEVVEVGPDCKFITPGMKILCNPSAAVFADRINGKQTMLVHESAAFAMWTDEEPLPFS